jgi:hypothetical protein
MANLSCMSEPTKKEYKQAYRYVNLNLVRVGRGEGKPKGIVL